MSKPKKFIIMFVLFNVALWAVMLFVPGVAANTGYFFGRMEMTWALDSPGTVISISIALLSALLAYLFIRTSPR